jgi:hypothetical protein
MPDDEQNSVRPQILPPDESRVQVIEHGVVVHVYRITEEQLENLAMGGKERSSTLALLALFGGVFASFLTAYLLMPDSPPLSLASSNFITIMCVASGFFTIIYLVKAVREWRKPDAVIRQIRRG